MRYVTLIILFLVMTQVNAFIVSDAANLPARATIAMGFMILSGYFIAKILNGFSLPLLTGYLLAGIVCGPEILNFVQSDVRESLRLVDELALALIAFNAGGEMDLKWIRERLHILTIILLCVMLFVFLDVTLAMWGILSYYFPIAQNPSAGYSLAAAIILGVMATGMSPSTVMAILLETKARGPVAETVLAITVAADLVILILFTITIGVIKGVLDPSQHIEVGHLVSEVGWEIGASLVFGTLLGFVMIPYLRKLGGTVVIGLLAISVLVVHFSEIVHLELLLVCLFAGFVVKNFSEQGDILIHGIESSSVGVYIIFFTLAGCDLKFKVLMEVWPIALAMFAVRTLAFFLGSKVGGWLAGAETSVANWAWTGYMGQAGISIAMVLIIQQKLPQLGGPLVAVMMSSIVLNQIAGPILFQRILHLTGEAEASGKPVEQPA